MDNDQMTFSLYFQINKRKKERNKEKERKKKENK